METTFQPVLTVNKETVNATVTKIKAYAKFMGYRLDAIPEFNTEPQFDSQRQMKACRRFMGRLNRRVTMGTANEFLHFIWRKAYKLDTAVPKLRHSEKEESIQKARKAWKKAQAESDKLHALYRTEKGDYYKQK